MKKKVLVVDDEKEIVDFLENFLARFNLSAIKAATGKEAVELYLEYKPQCVLLDISMPDKDGLTVLKELKKIDPLAKVIMITARDDKQSYGKAKKYGALDYITKPLDLNDLSQKIKEYAVSGVDAADKGQHKC